MAGSRGIEPRGGVGLAGRQRHLAWQEQLARLHLHPAVAQALSQQPVVAAPGKVEGQHLAMVVAEPHLARDHEGRRVVRGAAGSVLLHIGAGAETLGGGAEFPRPAAIEGQELVAGWRQGDGGHPVQRQRLGAAIGHRGLEARHAGGGIEGDGERDLDLSQRVAQQNGVTVLHRLHIGEGQLGDKGARGAMALQRRATGEAASGLGEQVEPLAAIQHAVRDGAVEQGGVKVLLRARRQRLAPIGQRRRGVRQRQEQRLVSAVEAQQLHAAAAFRPSVHCAFWRNTSLLTASPKPTQATG